jgi:hypothetical protein
MKTPALFPRYSQSRLTVALKDSPVVLVHGPWQFSMTDGDLYTGSIDSL